MLHTARGFADRHAVLFATARLATTILLVEYGPLVLDLELRFRVHALMDWLQRRRVPGVLELTPGIRSLQVHFDSGVLSQRALLDVLLRAEEELPAVDDIEVPSRIVHLPLSWDDPATRVAIDKYMQSVRKDAPWCPSNIEFIRRVNGLDSIDDVRRIVFDASYLVMGLGDVYLGAPVATPLDPRHRLVTTKYNPARTWTPENAVGIGGAYLCVYGHGRAGGYQFVGRTVQMWNRYRSDGGFQGWQAMAAAFLRSAALLSGLGRRACYKCARTSRVVSFSCASRRARFGCVTIDSSSPTTMSRSSRSRPSSKRRSKLSAQPLDLGERLDVLSIRALQLFLGRRGGR